MSTQLTKEDRELIIKDFTIESVKELYYYGTFTKKQCQDLVNEMIKLGKEYRCVTSDAYGNIMTVHCKNGNIYKKRLEGFRIVKESKK